MQPNDLLDWINSPTRSVYFSDFFLHALLSFLDSEVYETYQFFILYTLLHERQFLFQTIFFNIQGFL